MIDLGYGIKPQSHRAHRGRTTETTIYLGSNWWAFKDGWKIKNVERLCELCGSVVNNRSYLIKLFKQPIANLLIP